MGVTIQPQKTDDHYWVNNKSVYKDSNGNWISTEELTTTEHRAFSDYTKALERCQKA